MYKISLRSEADILQGTPAPLASFLAQNYPDAEAGTAIMPAGDFETLLAANDKKIYQKGVVTVDSLFLKVFPYKLVEGNTATALNKPNAVILTKELSRKLFGNADPMGKPIKIYNAIDGEVTGVMKMPQTPSHLDVQMLMRDPYGRQNMFWENYSYQTYIKLKQSVAEVKIADDINRLYYNERLKNSDKISFEAYKQSVQKQGLFIDAVPDIHNFPKHGSSNFTTVSILLILAVLLLLAGAINFSNLTIAKSMGRAKEVGIRKVLGSDRKKLILQFMSETAFQCLISLCIAMVVVYVTLPYLNRSFNISLSFWQNNAASIIAEIVVCLLLVILLSGLYPSLFLSRFIPVKVLKGDYSTGSKARLFRNSLIVVQFMVSSFFIFSTLVINTQMHYMKNKDKGFSDTQVLRIDATQKTRDKDFDAVKNTLLSIPGVIQVAKTTEVPGDKGLDTSTINFKSAGKEYHLASVKISDDYFKTLQVALVRGRLFTNDYSDQNTRTAIINETAVKKMNLANPIGQTISFPYCDSVPVEIVGVVKDFNVHGFETAVQPVVYTIGNKACMFQSGGAILVKLSSNHAQQSVAAIESIWKKIEPDFPIRYSFLDNNFQQLFISYERLQKIITFFTIVAIMISVMGLFALTAFFARQRTKEIGIRKVLGATVINLAALLTKEFIYLVLLSVLIITPVAWWAMHGWLQTFVYRIDIRGWFFITADLIIIFIALATVSFQSVKAAMANPVDSLRSE